MVDVAQLFPDMARPSADTGAPLPTGNAGGLDPSGSAGTPVPPRSTRRRAVVADDSPELRVLVASVLEYDGFAVAEVPDGEELVRMVTKMHVAGDVPDLIVTDVDMPHQDGLAALTAMGGAELGIPVILITAFASDEARVHAGRLGVAAVLSKPFGLEQLRALADDLTHDPMKRDATGARHGCCIADAGSNS